LDYQDQAGEPLVGAAVEALPRELRGRDRQAALLRLAFEALDPNSAKYLQAARLPLILCTHEADRPGARLDGLVSDLRSPNGAPYFYGRTAHIAAGAAGVVHALEQARTMFCEDALQACLIVGVDSLINARTISWLDRMRRLKTSRQSDGLIPGEAGCIILVSQKPPQEAGLAVLGLGFGKEPATITNEEPFRADGMTTALRNALAEAKLNLHEVDFRLSDVGGESYAFEELVLAQTRLMRQVRPEQPLWHPADCIGDCGAAAGFVQLAWAEQAWARGYAPGPSGGAPCERRFS
jgi:3-oxoacyl-[acyl-carrier-protein] synthase-1